MVQKYKKNNKNTPLKQIFRFSLSTFHFFFVPLQPLSA